MVTQAEIIPYPGPKVIADVDFWVRRRVNYGERGYLPQVTDIASFSGKGMAYGVKVKRGHIQEYIDYLDRVDWLHETTHGGYPNDNGVGTIHLDDLLRVIGRFRSPLIQVSAVVSRYTPYDRFFVRKNMTKEMMKKDLEVVTKDIEFDNYYNSPHRFLQVLVRSGDFHEIYDAMKSVRWLHDVKPTLHNIIDFLDLELTS